ncbi:hypothetical protein chiPu_0013834 [Chiloscyllium punctatum]|uniref:Uncharacterized protein n=1 Tax=Chiloscyllium punctatum TaxID=137246 RepID=A0A401SY72_CHIPU|nr:hypothetical protein [Chiloscyllium punctatum]
MPLQFFWLLTSGNRWTFAQTALSLLKEEPPPVSTHSGPHVSLVPLCSNWEWTFNTRLTKVIHICNMTFRMLQINYCSCSKMK